jgi:isopentenyldiphosphate isomerase
MNDHLKLAQDPNELFDVVRADGTPTGQAKRRGDVHRDGDWHRAVHVWVVGFDGATPFLMYQRRSLAKDTWPGKLDATVGGHYRAGETLEQAIREVDEEIGVDVSLSDLVYAGRRICINEAQTGIVDHELQDVYFLRDERPLEAFRPNAAELVALIRVPLPELMDFLAGDRDSVPALSCSVETKQVTSIQITAEDFIVKSDRYSYRVAIAAERFLAGERHFSV